MVSTLRIVAFLMMVSLSSFAQIVLGASNGGTSQSTWTKGDILCSSAANTLSKLTVGSNTNYLVADSTAACGIKWTASPTLPATKTAVAGQPLLSYDSATGLFTQGALTASQVGAAASTVTLTAGVGLSGGGDLSANRSFAVDSTEQGFITAGALTCGAATSGEVKVHTTPLQYCDNAATPTLRYAAYGDSAGKATTAAAADTVTTNANLTGPITSSGNATSIASQTGTGTKFVVDTNPTIVGPTITTPPTNNSTGVATSALGNASTTIGTFGTTITMGDTTADATTLGLAINYGVTPMFRFFGNRFVFAGTSISTMAGGLSATNINATTGFQVAGVAGTGKILVGNGTNYVASTPTFPNASATAGKVIKSDGTNWIASTGSASGVGTPTACTNQAVTGFTLASDAAPTSTCATITSSFVDTSVAKIIASGTSTFTTTAVASVACQTTVTTGATGALTTDTIDWAYATAPTAATDARLTIQPYLTANNVNFMRCNNTAASVTPTAIVVNWKVVR